MESNTQSFGLKTLINGATFDPTFYKNVDFDDMLKYLLTIRKLDSKHVKDIVSYFRRFRDLFFGTQPEEILEFNHLKEDELYKQCVILVTIIFIKLTIQNARN